MKISVVSRLARKKFGRKVPLKRAREKHMLEVEESSIKLYFVGFYCIGFSIKLVKNRA